MSTIPTEQVTTTGFTHGGDAVGRLADGMAVFVPGALPGEVVTVEVHDRRKTFAFARLLEVLEPAAGRIGPPCRFVAEGCGGCNLQHADLETQRALKTRVVREQLSRLGGMPDAPVADCVAVGPDTGYRNHARLHADSGGRIGFHAAGSHDVVEVDPCLVLAPLAQALLDEFRHAEGIVSLEIRGHDRTGATAVVIEPGGSGLVLPNGDTSVLLQQPDGQQVAFRGTGELTEVVAGHTYRFDASCFFQANTSGADHLVAAVLDAVGNVRGQVTWDLYAGVGLLSIPLAKAGAQVIAVEGHGRSSTWCATNADEARLGVDVRTANVASFVRNVPDEDRPEVVVLDPPRAGAGLDVVRAIAAAGPETVVYVACDVASLARDVKAFAAEGYRLQLARPLDLFPQTHHVEVVATLTR